MAVGSVHRAILRFAALPPEWGRATYGNVVVNAAADTAVVSSRDSNGAVIQDQNVPGTFCSQTYGP